MIQAVVWMGDALRISTPGDPDNFQCLGSKRWLGMSITAMIHKKSNNPVVKIDNKTYQSVVSVMETYAPSIRMCTGIPHRSLL